MSSDERVQAPHPPVSCGILPPYLLERLAGADDPAVRDAALESLRVDLSVRGIREERAMRSPRLVGPQDGADEPMGIVPPSLRRKQTHAKAVAAGGATAKPDRTVYDAGHRLTLPGTAKRKEGGRKVADIAVNEAYTGLGATWQLFYRTYRRNSLDDRGLALLASVHYGQKYDNAFWDGQQMVFGDGDGVVFNRFTISVDVIGHELAHGFTQYTSGLVYVAQSGALNESVSDVFGSLVKQRLLKQSADEADWLIGEGLFTPKVNGVALRSMKEPGTAYDDPQLGKDPQPGSMDDYQDLPHDANNDNGGVHLNSGIPNRAFYLAATAVGGNAWETTGQVWYDTMTNGSLPRDVDFKGFAEATVAAAEKRYGGDSDIATKIGEAWTTVKVLA